MSRSLNKITLLGHVGQDPEVRSTAGGARVANFSLATGQQFTDSQGSKQERTQWHRCVAWNAKSERGPQLADLIEKYVKKGDKIYVEGRVEYRAFEDRDKQTRHITEVIVSEVLLLGSPSKPNEASAEGARKAAPARAAAGAGRSQSDAFEEFPSALDGDDDLPF